MKTRTLVILIALAAARRGFFAAAASIVLAASANAQWVFNPANGHEYRLTSGLYWGASDSAARVRPDWLDAEAEAVSYGGHLVTINDQAEAYFLVSLEDPFNTDPNPGDADPWGGPLWIGLTDFGSEGSFYWISGEPVTFTRWLDAQPDNAGADGEDTVLTNANNDYYLGFWHDVGIQGPYRGIVERVGANRSPVAINDYYTVNQSGALTKPAPGLLVNDRDANPFDTLTTVLVTGPSHASSFQLHSDGSFSYVPTADYSGADSFTYKVYDGSVYSEPASVNITVRHPGSMDLVVAWGDNSYGQVAPIPDGAFSAVAAGERHSVAIRTDGTLFCWGDDHINGQVSGAPAGTFTHVAANEHHSVAIRTDGTVVTWGESWGGLLDAPAGTFIAVAGGVQHNTAIRTNGTLLTWGNNLNRLVSDTPPGTFIAVAANTYHSVAIRTDGTIVAWGLGGAVGGIPAGTFTAVATGAHHGVAIRTDGTLASWGDDQYGEVSGTPAGTFSAVAAGQYYSMAIRTDGTFVGWGGVGDLGSGAPAGTFRALACSFGHCLAVGAPVAPAPACAARIQPPINADGTSIFNSRRGVVPVKFRLTCDGNSTCGLPPATIAVTRTAGGVIGEVNESVYSSQADSGPNFRTLECQYHYNLNSSALGVGTYRVDILINSQVVGSATFELK